MLGGARPGDLEALLATAGARLLLHTMVWPLLAVLWPLTGVQEVRPDRPRTVGSLSMGVPQPEPRESHDLWPQMYDELRRLARKLFTGERREHTLQPTAVVHEAFARLRHDRRIAMADRTAFAQAVAATMERVLVDHARRRRSQRRGGAVGHAPLRTEVAGTSIDLERVSDVSAALDAFAAVAPRPAQAIRLREFAGLTEAEAARALGVSIGTVQKDTRYARAWLAKRLRESTVEA